MTLFQDTGGDPRAAAVQLADILSWYGAVADAACGNQPGFALRKAAVAVSVARTANHGDDDCAAIAFAGLLHAIGALGNPAYRKGERVPERLARMESWDVPAQGARICQTIGGLPAATADMVRWQAECWDGTGFPDQIRWQGIPETAQFLALADCFVRSADPDDSFSNIVLQSGRAFGPAAARIFTMWFHVNAGEVPPLDLPVAALTSTTADAGAALDAIADRVDEHNGVSARWRRVGQLAEATAAALGLDKPARASLSLAVRLYGAGELDSPEVEDSQFAPLARLGIENRARNAAAAAAFVQGNGSLGPAATVLAARSEWFDGTGKPHGLRHDAIPVAARVLSTAIAYDMLRGGRRSTGSEERGSPAERLDNSTGTQFDPKIVRALLEAAKARA